MRPDGKSGVPATCRSGALPLPVILVREQQQGARVVQHMTRHPAEDEFAGAGMAISPKHDDACVKPLGLGEESLADLAQGG